MSGVTITEFLLARIAEDEAAAERGRRHNDRGTFANDNYGCLLVDPARVLAECVAKRRIVNAWRAGFPDEDRYAMGWHDMHLRALAWLTLPYADHPDYDEAWRL